MSEGPGERGRRARSRPSRWAKLLAPLERVDLLGAAYDLGAPLPEVAPSPDVSVYVATEADLPDLAAVMEPHRQDIWDFHGPRSLLEMFRASYAGGDRCLVGTYRGTPAYMGWSRFSDASLARLGIVLPLVAGEACGYGVFAVPGLRRKGLATTVGNARLRWLRDLGIRRFYGWVNAANVPIITVQRRLGYRFVARLHLVHWRIKRRLPLVNIVTFDPRDPLADWCAPGRLSFRRGVTIFRGSGAFPPRATRAVGS